MSLSEKLSTIRENCGKILFLFPELKTEHPNVKLFAYWRYFDSFGEITLDPKAITNYHSIDRAFRSLIPEAYKNYKAEEEYREHYVAQKENV